MPHTRRSFLTTGLLCMAGSTSLAQQSQRIPAQAAQLIVAVADTWSSATGRLMLFERAAPNAPWQPILGRTIPVLFGKKGLAWGNGVLPVPHGQFGVPSKREKDLRAPAGVFRLGITFGNAPQAPKGMTMPYHQVTARDCWVDDPAHPAYNRHVAVDLTPPPPWYTKQRMRLGDFAYEWLLEIRHNADPVIPGQGSAIFFHIRRGPTKPSHGCTTMARADLLSLLTRLRPRSNPHYVLLPSGEYRARIAAWGLPPSP